MRCDKNLLTLIVLSFAAGHAARAELKCQIGILKPTVLAGNYPGTLGRWKLGDQYRFAFFTSGTTTASSENIETYNSWVQSLADASPLGIGAAQGVTWKAIGSTPTVDARDNTGTNPNIFGTGFPIYLLNGQTLIAKSNPDLWDGYISSIINITEQGVVKTGWPFTGTYKDGTKSVTTDSWSWNPLGGTQLIGNELAVGQGNSSSTSAWIWRIWTGDAPSVLQGMYALSEPLTIIDPSLEPLRLTLTPNGNSYTLRWRSLAGKVYDLRSSTSLATPILTWPIYSGYVGLAPSGTGTNTLSGITPSDTTRFFVIVERDPTP